METCCEFIHIKKNGTDGTSYPLTCGTEMVLGSDKSCDFRIQLPSVSQKHVKINIKKDGKVFVSKIGESSSMLLNGQALMKPSFVHHDSTLSIGTLNFKFRYSDDLADKMIELRKSPMPQKSPKRNKENIDSNLPSTPNSGSPKKRKSAEKVPTPIPAKRSRRSSNTRLSVHSTSLVSIPESEEPTPSPHSRNNQTLPVDSGSRRRSVRQSGQKNVSFGPLLSPEFFDRRMPPNTPIKRGSIPMFGVTLQSLQESNNEIDDSDEEQSMVDDGDNIASTSLSSIQLSEESKEFDSSIQSSPATHPMSLPTPLKNAIKEGSILKKTKKSLPTPLKKAIKSRPVLRTMRRSLPTPVRQGIKTHPGLKKTKKSLATPLKADIHGRPSLRKTKKSMPTPLRTEIKSKPKLKKTKESMPTPLRAQIESKPGLRKTKKSLPTPLKSEIKAKPSLRKTKMSLPTPVKKEIQEKPSLRKTKKSLPTPLRSEIKSKPALRKTKQTMPTPLRNEIKSKPALRKTLRSMPTPLRDQIRSKPSLRKTLKSMPTPLRTQIRSRPALKATKKTLPTPLRQEIKSKPSLRKTKKSLPTPIRAEISGRPSLRKTKMSLPTPVRKEILSKPALRKTKKSMPTPVRKEIASRPQLRKTKQSLPTPVRADIQSRPKLRATKRSLPSPLKAALKAKHILKKTKKALPSDLIDEIKLGYTLKKTKKSLPTPIRQDISSKPSLRKTKKSMPTPVRKEIESCPSLRNTKRSVPTPLRLEIESRPSLRKVMKSLPTPLKDQIKAKPTLKHVAKVAAAQPKTKSSRKRNRSIEPSTPLNLSQPARKRQRVNPVTPMAIVSNISEKNMQCPTPVTNDMKNSPTVHRKNIIESIPSFSPMLDSTALRNMFRIENTTAVDPADYFEPFLFQAQETTQEVPKKRKARTTRSKPKSTAPVKRSTRSRKPEIDEPVTAEPVNIKRSTRNSRSTISSSASIDDDKETSPAQVPTRRSNRSVATTQSTAKTTTTRVTRNRKADVKPPSNTVTEINVSEPISTERSDSTTPRAKRITRKTRNSSNIADPVVLEDTSNVSHKRSTRSAKKSSLVETQADKSSEEPSTRQSRSTRRTAAISKSSEEINEPIAKQSKRGRKPVSKANSEPVGDSEVTNTRRTTRSQQKDTDSNDIHLPTAPKRKRKDADVSKHVQFAPSPEKVTSITPHVLRRSARLKAHK